MTGTAGAPAPRARIRLDALRHNYARLKCAAGGAGVIAVIKADAYGHGQLTVARALPDADAFAVARLPDALQLVEAGIEQPIMLLGGVYSRPELDAAITHRLELVVHCEEQIALLEAAGSGRAIVWLELETGMHRLGMDCGRAGESIRRLKSCAAVSEVRLMTHLATADERSDDGTPRQLARFSDAVRHFDGPVSIANSPGLLGWPNALSGGFDPGCGRARCGISLYGISPFAEGVGVDFGLRPVMHFESSLIGVKPVRAGARVGYGGTWQADADTVIGIVAAGYGDGYSRFLPSGTPVLVNGHRARLAGRVSMDVAAIDLGPGARARIGDPVVLWGDGLAVEEVAKAAGTIPYQLLCGVKAQRLPEDAPDRCGDSVPGTHQ